MTNLTIHDLDQRELLIYRERIGQRRKSPLVTWLLWFFLGGVGGHRYYLGYAGRGIAMTLTLGGLGVWTLVDAFLIPGALRKNLAQVEEQILVDIAAARDRGTTQ